MNNITIREKTEKNEHLFLSPLASFADCSRGRERNEDECPIRTVYQRDRDRIIHSKSFRRLKHKTQVFLAPFGDHYRTRLTHTLEVSQIARTLARALSLNEDLTEAIALGHDLGHTPFGHIGERALARICPGGFNHNSHGLRIVTLLEKDGAGLNLTHEVRDGILNHQLTGRPETLEGHLVRLADKIAYISHDIDDATRAGLMTTDDVPLKFSERFGTTLSERINSMVTNVIENSGTEIRMDDETFRLFCEFRQFMFDNLYFSRTCEREAEKINELLKLLYEYFLKNADYLPSEYRAVREKEGVERAVCDYVAGMTDSFAIATFNELFVPKTWRRV